ncbi:hypothetical protein [Bradyrhizobium cajani]|uniref:hypothetical protein n=1 Tax=Bradyrhizobium cajani TaxID=1928661 RepID=UPI00197ACCA1|nr:hypothetical protein [Bradyrhizobium cajani]
MEWNGQPVASVKTGFASAVRLAKPDVSLGNVTPHTLRHTAARWSMQRAAPMWEAAGFLGMSEKTLRETYGHHHPDHLRVAANARHRNVANFWFRTLKQNEVGVLASAPFLIIAMRPLPASPGGWSRCR